MTDDLDVALNDLYPLPAREDPETLRRVRTHVLASVEEMPAAAPMRARRRWWPRLVLPAAALAMSAVVVVVLGRAPDGAMVEVAQTLNTAADAQIRTVDEPVPAGRYRYIVTHTMDASYGETVVLFGRRYETWVPADRTAEWFQSRTYTGERIRLTGPAAPGAEPPAPADPGAERLTGRCGRFHPDSVDQCTGHGDWQGPTESFAAGLPRDPGALFQRLRDDTEGHGNDPDQEILVYVADALRSGTLPADLRAALYRALTRLPTLEIVERAATLDGHTGTAFGISAAGERREIVIDPLTGAFIGERTRLTEDRDGVPKGTVVGSSTVRYDIVDEPWRKPAN